MAAFKFERKLCLNDVFVPLETREMEFSDIHGITGEEDFEGSFNLLNLRATHDAHWLQKALKLPAKWWVRNQAKLPLMHDISEAIMQSKKTKGGAARLPRQEHLVVAIRVRERVLLVQNSTRCQTIAIKDGDEPEVLTWLLEQIQKDVALDTTAAPASPRGSSVPQKKSREDLEPCDTFTDEALETLRKHPACSRAWFLPSRSAIKVSKHSKGAQSFTLTSKKRKKAQAADCTEAWGEWQAHVSEVVASAIRFLEQADQPEETLEDDADPPENLKAEEAEESDKKAEDVAENLEGK